MSLPRTARIKTYEKNAPFRSCASKENSFTEVEAGSETKVAESVDHGVRVVHINVTGLERCFAGAEID